MDLFTVAKKVTSFIIESGLNTLSKSSVNRFAVLVVIVVLVKYSRLTSSNNLSKPNKL